MNTNEMNELMTPQIEVSLPLNSNLIRLHKYYENKGSQDLMFIENNHLPFKVAYSISYDGEETRMCYNAYESYEDFIQKIKGQPKEHMRWNELHSGGKVPECYDLDAGIKDVPKESQSKKDKQIKRLQQKMFQIYKEKGADYVINKFLEHRKDFIQDHNKKYDQKEEEHGVKFAVLTACDENKFSAHIVVRNGMCFEDMEHLKHFMNKFHNYLIKDDVEFIFDNAIYTKHRGIRMEGMTKFKTDRFLVRHSMSEGLDDKDFLFWHVKQGDKLYKIKIVKKVYVENSEKRVSNFSENNSIDDYKEMTQLLNLVNSDCDRKKWSSVGQCIYTLTTGSDEGLEEFIKWSKKDGYDFNENNCITDWNSHKVNPNYNLIGLKGLAKEDSPEEYEELYPKKSFLKKDSCPVNDDEAYDLATNIIGDCTHNNCAKIYAEHSKGEIFYTSGYGWIIFDNKLKIWTWNNNEKALKYPISSFFSDIIKEYIKSAIDTKRPMMANKHEEKELQEKVKSSMKIREKVGNSSFAQGVIDQLQSLLTKENEIIDRFDAKSNLFAFSDGKVIDLNNGGQVRDIEKEDYIMTTCGYPYPKRNTEYIDKVMEIINSLSNEPDQIRSILSALSLPLWGGNKNELFIQFTGNGGNGKGLLDTGIKHVLGNYYSPMNSNQLTSYEKESGRANSELAGCRFSRLVMCSEPEDSKDATLKSSIIKKLTGGDPIKTRFMYKDPITFTAKFVLMLQLNGELNLSTCDDAMKRRLKVIELPFSFVKNEGQPLESNQKYRDESLKQKISTDNYRNAFLHILIDTWLENNGIFYESRAVKTKTNAFIKSQNPVIQWFEENFEVDRDNKILASDMKKKFDEYNEYQIVLTQAKFTKLLKEACELKLGTGNKQFAFCKEKINSVDTSDTEENQIVRLLPRK